MKKLAALLPLILAAALIAIFTAALMSGRDAQNIPSALLNRPAPNFTAPPLIDGSPIGLRSSDFKGAPNQVTLMNVWASWCTPCRAEHPYMLQLAENPAVQLVGLNYKDKPDAAMKFLKDLGNPYAKIGTDNDGTIAINYGVYGVPETYVIDHTGTIRYKITGPVTSQIIETELTPLIRALTQEAR
jgi:cytochrome c biogenesis protein CcmG/thiol:disulfide interchange protein DsbE